MATLGFEDYIDPLKVYLTHYREMEGDSKGTGKGGETSGKRDPTGGQPSPNVQLSHQGSFNQALNYGNTQVDKSSMVEFSERLGGTRCTSATEAVRGLNKNEVVVLNTVIQPADVQKLEKRLTGKFGQSKYKHVDI